MEEKNKEQFQEAQEENQEEEEQSSGFGIPGFDFGFVSRMFGPAKILFKMHLRVASLEFKRDSQRILGGVVSLCIGLFFLVGFWVFLQVIAILLLNKLFTDPLFSVLIIGGVNLLIALIAIFSAVGAFKKPMMQETKKILEETMKDLS